MKPGWCDIKYIPNKPQRLTRRSSPTLVSPAIVLRTKLHYDQYRQRPTSVTPVITVPVASLSGKPISPGEALERRLHYAQHRPDDAAQRPVMVFEGLVSTSDTPHKTRHRQAARPIVDRGLGANEETIMANARQWAGPHIYSLSLVFSADPGLVMLVEAAGIDPATFTMAYTDQYLPALFHDRQWGEVAFSYVIHEKPDEFGRPHWHAHITAPGTIVDAARQRVKFPYIDEDDTLASQRMADRVVELELDRTLGPAWRQLPEYVAYVEALAITAAAAVNEAPTPARKTVNTEPPPVFMTIDVPRSAPAAAPESPTWALVMAAEPTGVLDDAPDVFTDHAWAVPRYMLPNRLAVSDAASFAINDEQVDTPDPAHTATIAQKDREKVLPKTQRRVRSRPYNWQLVPDTEPLNLALALTSHWDAERGEGVIVAHARYLSTLSERVPELHSRVYRSSVAEQLFDADGEETTFADALEAAKEEVAYQYRVLQTALADDPAGARRNLYAAWYQTIYRDTTRYRDSYFPGAPPDAWPEAPGTLEQGLDRLPGLHWVSDPRTGDQYSMAFEPLAAEPLSPGEADYQLVWYRQWQDAEGNCQLTGRRTRSPAQTLEGNARFVQQATRRLQADFDRPHSVAQPGSERSSGTAPTLPYAGWLMPYAHEADWVQPADDPWVAYAVRDRSDAARDWARLDLVARWYDQRVHRVAHSQTIVASNLPTDYADLDRAIPESYADLQYFSRTRHEQDVHWTHSHLRDNPTAQLADFHQSWLERTALDPKARARGFLPALPTEHLPPGLRTRGLDEDPLPLFHLLPDGTFGVDYPLTGPTYAVALQAVADGPDRYCLHVIKFWHDEQGQKHQVASMIIAFPAGKEESLSWLHQLHANVADDVTHGMRELQDLWAAFNQRPGNFLTKGPPNPFDDLPVVNDAPPPPAASPPKSTVRPPEQMGQPRRNDRDLPARELPDRSTPEQDFPDLGRW